MDFYLQEYPDDQVIASASVDLVVAMFKAIENVVIFYTSSKGEFRLEFDALAGVDGGWELVLLQLTALQASGGGSQCPRARNTGRRFSRASKTCSPVAALWKPRPISLSSVV
ncbi:hypothetical protein IMZ48_42625 [Candidatus Bathyarchaeota archaeon]|nr:hypothetical protein [Candidatus Bathyarchaeota archaeon]